MIKHKLLKTAVKLDDCGSITHR